MSTKKPPVSINVFPTLDYIELIQYEEKTGEIEKAAALPCQFDSVARQMADSDVTLQTIRDLYNMSRIPFSTPSVLVLPSFFTREIELPAEFSKEELRFALVSEAERFYIFKKVEPQIDWIELEKGRLLYSAFPKAELEKYVKIFQELGIPLLAIELNYFSMVRGLMATGAVSNLVNEGGRWCLLTVSDNSFFTAILEGVKIQKTADAWLSVTEEDSPSTTTQEVQQDFEAFVEGEAFEKLILVNNANRINSEDLLSHLNVNASVVLIEQNALTLRSRGAMDGPFPCTLEGLGGVFHKKFPELPGLNFLPETSEDVVGILHARQAAFKWLLISNGVTFIVCLLIGGLMWLIGFQKEQERNSLSQEAAQMGKSFSPTQLNDVNRKKYIKQVVDQNVKINNFLVQIGVSAQNGVWLDKLSVEAQSQDALPQVALDGRALSLDQVNQLLGQLNKDLQTTELEVSSVAPSTSPDGQAYFTWSIKNKAASTEPGGNAGANPAPPPAGPSPNASPPNAPPPAGGAT